MLMRRRFATLQAQPQAQGALFWHDNQHNIMLPLRVILRRYTTITLGSQVDEVHTQLEALRQVVYKESVFEQVERSSK